MNVKALNEINQIQSNHQSTASSTLISVEVVELGDNGSSVLIDIPSLALTLKIVADLARRSDSSADFRLFFVEFG